MKRRSLAFLVGLFALAGCGDAARTDAPRAAAAPGGGDADGGRVHDSPIAGQWYPGDPEELGRMLDRFLAGAQVPDDLEPARCLAFVTPHAGYAYSGPTAARVYRLLAARAPKRVVILGPSHHVAFRGVSIGDFRSYRTPLGEVPVDRDAVARLRRCPLVSNTPAAHAREHSVDIQVPFLQRVLREGSYTIVPVVVGRLAPGDYSVLAGALKSLLDDRTAVLASTDFTHYGARFGYTPFPLDEKTGDNIRALDRGAIEAIESLERDRFLAYREETGATICGFCPVALTMSLLPDDARATLLGHALSGDSNGDYAHSVSYVAMAFSSASGNWPKPTPEEAKTMTAPPENSAHAGKKEFRLDEKEEATLLRVARDSLERFVAKGERVDPMAGDYEITENLRTPCGAFVTYHERGDLRGCIGDIIPRTPLIETVARRAVDSAVNDRRFTPVGPGELKDIDIEISVLSPMRRVESPDDIVIGKHGVLLKRGFYQAVFLPQVAPEQGWDIEQTLAHLSRKAGMTPDGWKHPETEFLVFTAQVFGEKE